MAQQHQQSDTPAEVGGVSEIPVYCTGCGRLMGHMVQNGQQGVIFFRTLNDGFLARMGKTWCPSCGRVLHFSPPRGTWGDLVAQYKKSTKASYDAIMLDIQRMLKGW